MLTQLRPMDWREPPPEVLWEDDYADLLDRIQRTGGVDQAEPPWPDAPGGGDPFAHAGHVSPTPERRAELAKQRAKREAYYAEQDRRYQQQLQAMAQARQAREQQAAALREAEEAAARAFWAGIDPQYAEDSYSNVGVGRDLDLGIGDVVLKQGSYWLPHAVINHILAMARA